jgi:ribosomal protein L7Ae-like RNA K-turn-binding protein
MNNAFLTLLGFAQKAGKLVAGEDTVHIALKKKKVKLLIVAGDASDNTKDRANQWKASFGVELLDVLDKDTLSQAIGKSNRALIGVIDQGFATQMLKLYSSLKTSDTENTLDSESGLDADSKEKTGE